jgi:hypothetical protein
MLKCIQVCYLHSLSLFRFFEASLAANFAATRLLSLSFCEPLLN